LLLLMIPGNELKFGRAMRHANEASSLLAAYLGPKPYTIRRDEDPVTGLSFWITLRTEPPEDIALAVGDCIHNLRSALDHVVYELSCHTAGKHVPDTGFPILLNPQKWKSISGQQLRAVPGPALKRIEQLQPFHGLEAMYWTRERLLHVHELDIADKHRDLNLAVANVPNPGVLYAHDGPPLKVIAVHKGRLIEGIETLLLRFDPSVDMTAKVQPDTFVEVVFEDAAPLNRAPAAGPHRAQVEEWDVEATVKSLVFGVDAVLREIRQFF
jgi:hypothetical protein